ncbi:MAG: Nramp family divalent metal transporter [Acidobacteria bacterium]|nr:Nramp family divalent metal transporter [Acidobacteriota bacterium]
MEAWKSADLPVPPQFGLRNFFRVIGPGAILLATSIGSGEWLIGPASIIRYGAALLGIVTVSVTLQVILNIEMMRYTVLTGEPIFTGFMRLARRPWLVGITYVVFGILHIGWPAFAATSAAALFAAVNGRLPEAADSGSLYYYALFTFLLAFVILISGRTVERTLEVISWVMIALIFAFLIVVNVAFISPSIWWSTAKGLVFIGPFGSGFDWTLLGGFAAYAGAGGVVNLMMTNWARDKGIGMGARVGAISAIGSSHRIKLSPAGFMCPANPQNISNWKQWMKFVHAEQIAIWGFFCLLGMFLTVNMAVAFVPAGSDLTGLAAGAYQAEFLARAVGPALWALTLLNGFWILFSTQLALMDGLPRLAADIFWSASPRVRAWVKDDVRKLYYGLLVVFVLWGTFALRLAQPLTLILIGANVAGFILCVSSIHIVLVNRRLLPAAFQAGPLRELLMLAVSLFFGFFVVMNLV